MSIPLDVNGTEYAYPETGDTAWGPDATDWAVAVTTGMLQKAGGLFILLDEVDFGSNFGLKSVYFTTRSANPAAAGVLRLANTDAISFRNFANSADLSLTVNASNQLLFNGAAIGNITTVTDTATIDLTLTGTALSADIVPLSITNGLISASAAIAYSKLNLTGSIVEADIVPGTITNTSISASAAIAYTKLNLTGAIVNADVAVAAAIALTKLATVTADRALVSSAGGVISPSAVTATELGYVSGVTSAIQTQFTGKQASSASLTALAALASTGFVAQTAANTFADRTLTGTANQIAITNGTGAAGAPVFSIVSNPIVPGTASITIPGGGTAARPGSPTAAMIRYNSDLLAYEGYASGAWGQFGVAGAGVSMVGVNTAATALGTATYTLVPFTATTDTNSAWSGTAYTIPTTGFYALSCTLRIGAGGYPTTSAFDCLLRLNGTTPTENINGSVPNWGNGSSHELGTNLMVARPFTAGDVLRIYAQCTSAAALSTTANTLNYISIVKVY